MTKKIEISNIVEKRFDKISYDKTIKVVPLNIEAEKKRIAQAIKDLTEDKKSIFEIIWWLLKQSPKIINLIIFLINLKEKSMTQSTLDTIKGIVRALALLAGVFGVNISPENTEMILTAIASVWAVIEFVLGLLSNSKHIAPPN